MKKAAEKKFENTGLCNPIIKNYEANSLPKRLLCMNFKFVQDRRYLISDVSWRRKVSYFIPLQIFIADLRNCCLAVKWGPVNNGFEPPKTAPVTHVE